MSTVYVVRRHDGKYFQGCGYGGPGHPVPYWTEEIRQANVYLSANGARNAAKRWGGFIGIAEGNGEPERWIGFLVWQRGSWATVNEPPADFDPNDHEGNNGPL